jgi:exopolysaccharide biosynthesis polyprenyl glycosylphosphotransferase
VAAAGDFAIAVAALAAAFWIRSYIDLPGTEGLLPTGRARIGGIDVLAVGAAQIFSFWLFGLYGARERFRDPLARLLLPALFVQLIALAAFYFLAYSQPDAFPRSVLVVAIVLNGTLAAAWRLALDRLFPQPRRRVVIIGTGPAAMLIADTIRKHPWTGVEVVGLIGEGAPGRPDLPVLGPLDRLADIAAAARADEVVLTPEEASWRDRLAEKIPADWFADLLVWPSPFETMIGRLRFRIVGDLPLLEARVRALEGPKAAVKRVFDAVVSAVLLVLAAPLLAVAALAVAATSRGGVFYRQRRVGKDGQNFDLWKLRTMRRGAETDTGAVLATPSDPRVTAAGRFLRATRVDEIPQLWNVLRGDMSLVGPRPERPELASRIAATVPGWRLRHAVRPGLTGLAQVSGEYGTEPEIKLRYDLAYLNNWSLGLDLAILLKTLPVILTRRGI